MRRWRLCMVLLLAALTCVYGDLEPCPGLVETPQPQQKLLPFINELSDELQKLDGGEGVDLIFYGDSITETWRGTDQGGHCDRCSGVPDIFNKYFGKKYQSDVMAVGGDQVAHLEWRLLNGQIPQRKTPKLAVLMIGTNDLGAVNWCSQGNSSDIAEAASGVIKRIFTTIDILRTHSRGTKLLLLALLPRGDELGPDDFDWPGNYSAAILKVNKWLKNTAAQQSDLNYLDCSPLLLSKGKITKNMQVDGLHPSRAGMQVIAECLSGVVDKLMANSIP